MSACAFCQRSRCRGGALCRVLGNARDARERGLAPAGDLSPSLRAAGLGEELATGFQEGWKGKRQKVTLQRWAPKDVLWLARKLTPRARDWRANKLRLAALKFYAGCPEAAELVQKHRADEPACLAAFLKRLLQAHPELVDVMLELDRRDR